MTFLEWIMTWFFADHLASKQEEAEELDQLKDEVQALRSEIDYLKERDSRDNTH